ncbi:MAG: C39 family peptidase [Anaerolineae bacterium]|nr:C39 family peptidase [Anaerolineae bacterium]
MNRKDAKAGCGRPNAKNIYEKLGVLCSFAVKIFILFVTASLLPRSAHAQEPPQSAFIEGVIGHPQEHNLSCESRSATDLAAFWGVTLTEDDFFHRLPKSDNPHRGFLGDVDMPAGTMPPYGYGVYAGPIAANLRSFGLDAHAHRYWNLNDLRAELAAGRPVIIWSTYSMKLPGVQEWTSSDGETSIIAQWQHTFIAVGYDPGGVYLIDAYDAGTKQFSYEAFDAAWAQLERLAVTVTGPLRNPAGQQTWQSTGNGGFIVDGRWETKAE